MRSTALVLVLLAMLRVDGQRFRDIQFEPKISANCVAGYMEVIVNTDQPFQGVIHAKDYRKPQCSAVGDGRTETRLRVPLLVSENDVNYCGVEKRRRTEDRSFPVAVRVHKTLELAEDKLYIITCGRSWFKNARNETFPVSLDILKDGKKITQVIMNEQYTLRAKVSSLSSSFGIKVKSCFSFSGNYTETPHIDDYGCPVDDLMSSFVFNETTQAAEATIFSMFKFPDSSKIHIQCEVAVCPGGCDPLFCDDEYERLPNPQARLVDIVGRNNPDEKVVMASTTAYVLEPGQGGPFSENLLECDPYPNLLLYICIALAVALVILLVAFIFMCASMTCSCTKSELIEKEPSIIDDYDPYKIGWSGAGSHYGSRFSLNGKNEYMSGASTLNSTRSYSTAGSDHYAIVHSRPGSSHYSSSKPEQRNRGGVASPVESYHSAGKM